MATITTLRPSAVSSGVGWSAVPSGTLADVTSDDNDATHALWSGDGSALILGTPLDAPPAGERRHLVRIRARGEDGSAWWAVRLATGSLVAGAAATFASSPETITGSWQAGAPPDGSTIMSCYVTGQTNAVKIVELYLDVDSREAPDFTPVVLDGSGASTVTVADTNQPTLRANALALDGLPARQYRFWVTLGGVTVWDTGVVSGAPVNRQTAPLANGSYVANYQVWTTIGANIANPSAVEQLAFTVNVGAVPAPDAPVVTPELPLVRIEVCGPESSGFDDYVSWIEIERVDCDSSTVVAIVGPLEEDECAEAVDFSAPRTDVGLSCTHDPEPCCSYYRVRTVAFVDGLLLVSDWTEDSAELVCLVWSEDEHLVRTDTPDGPLWTPVWGKFEWDVVRPFTASTGVNGSRFVTSAPPGGRNLHMVAAVESEAGLAELHAVLARPLVLISPSDASEVWAAPVTESVRVVKVGRIREVRADFIATGPQPAPQHADVGT
jgi:hypothetical protein